DVAQQLYDLVADAADPVRANEKASAAEEEEGSVLSHAASPEEREQAPSLHRFPAGSASPTQNEPQQGTARLAHPPTHSDVPARPAPPPARSRTSSVLQTADTGPAAASTPARVDSDVEDDDDDDDDDDDSDDDVSVMCGSVVEPFDYEAAATAVMELFAKNVHEPTKVAGMRWLLLLHQKAPWRILTPTDMSFPVLLKMLSDASEQVVRLDLELFAQIARHSAAAYLDRFVGSLLQMFATDRVLLETRAALMVRQLCVVLDPQRVFCLFARLLVAPGFGGDLADLEFVAVMVQHLSWILVTAPETEALRLLLREYSAELDPQLPPLASVRDAVAAKDPAEDYGDSPVLKPATKQIRAPPLAKPSTVRAAPPRSRNSVDGDRLLLLRARPDAAQQMKRRQLAEAAALGQRGRALLASALGHVERGVERSRLSHALFLALFPAWSHSPASALTLCLLSQHYAVGAALVGAFGSLPQDLTVSFLVQLDKLVQLVESPVFTYLRLQLLEPLRHAELLRALYGLLMLLPQSSAFAILRNRLASVAMPPARLYAALGSTEPSPPPPPVSSSSSSAREPDAAALSAATGAAPADVTELVRLLAVLATHPSSVHDDDEPARPSAAGLLQQVAEFHADPAAATAEHEAAGGAEAVVVSADTARLVDEYRVVRSKYAQALARHQSR
ncbi:hypothetical protein GGI24_001590, partial [Coemansia furcata]